MINTCCSIAKPHFPSFSSTNLRSPITNLNKTYSASLFFLKDPPSLHSPRLFRPISASLTTKSAMAAGEQSQVTVDSVPIPSVKLLFVEMGVGYDQHGQDVTSAAMRACRDAITSNSIPAFRRGSIPGVSFEEMKLQIKLGVPRSLQHTLDVEKVKSVFPYGKIVRFEVVDGGLICSSGVQVEEMGDKNDDCYIVNAAVYVGY